ncbi:hypothetical protein K7396_09445 [Streptomyces angustmyceticus]|uniref:hypothetical protein n=1 Tax=Streptomyces angustmyceticus TaxID=285578 RepID=UPI001C3F81D0|nr:hypothetical protein [Streptomyces angustmyceticus]UAL66732.1 hypothetical protein K7396_09445 [Streptomyces angustmyceticus]
MHLQPLLARLTAKSSGPRPGPPGPCALLVLADDRTTHVRVGRLSPAGAQDLLHAHLDRLWNEQVR